MSKKELPVLPTEEEFLLAIQSSTVRKAIAAKSFRDFCLIYFSHYFVLPPADFHPELIDLLENDKERFLAIEGFRGSAKSSYAGLALVLWHALHERTKFIILINETDEVVKITIANLREELQNNELIVEDFGDLMLNKKLTASNEKNVVLANGVRIMGRSRGQKIRGLRHVQHRPGLVIIDDVEEVGKVDKKEYRDKTEKWIRGVVIPAMNENKARLIVLGNKLHSDAIMERLKNHRLFTYRAYPLIDPGTGKVTWEGKYPTKEALKAQEDAVGSSMWQREYLLKVIPPEGQEIKEEWIRYYDALPPIAEQGLHGTGVDLAISQKETADFTTMVSGISTTMSDLPRIYIKPFPVNAHLSFHETIETARSMTNINPFTMFFVEDVAYQKAAIQEMERALIPVTAMRAGGDKRARLRAVATYVQNGTILFPKEGCEDLIMQLLEFGVAEHDDLVDGWVYLILGLIQQGMQNPEVVSLF